MASRLKDPGFAHSADAGFACRVRLPVDAQSGPDGQDAAGRAGPSRIDQDQPADLRRRAPGCPADHAVKVVPKPPYHIQALDTLQIFVLGTLPDQNIAGPYPVEADGTITLGPAYGSIKVSDLTLSEAKEAIVEHLKNILTAPKSRSAWPKSWPAADRRGARQALTAPSIWGPTAASTWPA